MEVIIATNPLKGKCFTCLETTISLIPSESSLKALPALGLFGKVVAPMNVDENAMVDFAAKTWKKKVSVVAMEDHERISNCFEFGFEAVEDKDKVLQNGPWCFCGYTIVLKEWSPKTVGPVVFKWLRIWMQIHNLPHEYFSCANGNLLGSLAGKVVKVDLEDDKPFTWSKVLRVLVDIDFEKPLVSGCFFDLANGVKQWLQFKFEKVGIFCYKCGILGHRRRGCSLSSPVMISDTDRGVQARSQGNKVRAPLPSRAVDGNGGDRSKPPGPSNARRFRNPLKTTSRPIDATGSEGDKGHVFGEKFSTTKPVLALEGRNASILETGLNLEKEALNGVGGGPIDIGPSTLVGPAVGSSDVMGPHGLNCLPSAIVNGGGGPLQTHKDSNLSGVVDKAHSTTMLDQKESNEAINNKLNKSAGLGAVQNSEEKRALAHFFEAQENLFYDLKHFGELDLKESLKALHRCVLDLINYTGSTRV
ncbi:hypothetical protein G4B88_019266 [Cannabis sativa]|uniref:CCHC-type domain-containing protein n=1 Tax=Cannabis sativa TaxID=3483 RepID=A0A7J6HMG6_CANSA|nr:hypothetical protein G4B88_019266 [Cannabis sativa]